MRCHERITKKTDKEIDEYGKSKINEDAVLRFKADPKNVLQQDIKTFTTFQSDAFAAYFNNDNSDNQCPITICSLMKPGCANPSDSSNVRIHQVNSKWAIQAHLNKPYGFIENFCVSCTNGGKNVPETGNAYNARQTVTYDNLRVHLPSKCSYAMTEKTSAPTAQITYDHDDANKGDIIFSDGFGKFFNNADTSRCPVKQCTMFKKDCTTAWDGGVGNSIAMDTKAPWAVTIKDNTFAGYGPDEACVVCDNEFQIIKFPHLKIKQTGRCIDKIEKRTLDTSGLKPYWPKPIWKYDLADAKTPETFVDSWERLFNNKDPEPTTHCQAKACEVREKDCSKKWNFVANPGFSMAATAPFALTASKDQVHGFNYDVCVWCNNGQ